MPNKTSLKRAAPPLSDTSVAAPSDVVVHNRICKGSWERLKSSSIALCNKMDSKRAFPPTMFIDTSYSNGILILCDDDPATNPPSRYFSSSSYPRLLPILSVEEGSAWCHKHAAHMAASRRYPFEAARLVGTITFHLQEQVQDNATDIKSIGISNTTNTMGPFAYSKQHSSGSSKKKELLRKPPSAWNKYCKSITQKQARDEAEDEESRKLFPSYHSDNYGHIHMRAERIHSFWSSVVQPSKPRMEGWDAEHGGLACVGYDPNYVPLPALKYWIAEGRVTQEPQQPRTKELYNGLCSIPIDIIQVLKALTDLSDPTQLYQIPLVIPYPVVEALPSGSNNTDGLSWKVVIGVYVHRLLPEVITMESLHIVMSALDSGSYRVTEPLHLPPFTDKKTAVFQSNPYPKVQWPLDDSSTCDIAESQKEEIIDLTATEGSTREEPIISPFTVRGLLKLLESEGCDVQNWPVIANSVTSKLKLNLMLHQIHAICWMVQMESLSGFGINSILWEEREFWDGGKYYYSPALGQIRLRCPPNMKGGLLIDEMGLGKTVSTIGLILATLNELKLEASKGALHRRCEAHFFTHATLIVVPPTLIMQWQHEICKAAGDSINVSIILPDNGLLKPLFNISDTSELERTKYVLKSSDIVLTTYGALIHKKTNRYLSQVGWGRIVLDEMQEIRSSTTQISNSCNKLICNRRWMLSGTPLFEGIDDLRGELNFLRLEPFAAALEDGFFEFAIKKQWVSGHQHAIKTLRILGLVALRRSKDMCIRLTSQPILDLEPLTVQFVPVSQTPSERAIYCWLESLVLTELKRTSSADGKRDKKSRSLCLRLLREFCITPVLLNGGLGASSQLHLLHSLMVGQNRRVEVEDCSEQPQKKQKLNRIMSCDQAIRFLTQVRRSARTEEDFITDVFFSTGGSTRRDIAHESVEVRYAEATAKLRQGIKNRAEAIKKRAAFRWHIALELVTTGMASSNYENVCPKFNRLWRWRTLVILAHQQREDQGYQNLVLPNILSRGWRPSPSFLRRDLYRNNPNFYWAHPISFHVDHIPTSVTQEELQEAFYQASRRSPMANLNHSKILQLLETQQLDKHNKNDDSEVEQWREEHKEVQGSSNVLLQRLRAAEEACCVAQSHDDEMKHPKIIICKIQESEWTAIVQFNDEQDAKFVLTLASKSNGIPLKSTAEISHISSEIKAVEEKVNQLEAENNVHPSKANFSALLDARKQLNVVREGLRIVTEEKHEFRHVILSKPVGPYRSLLPRSFQDLMKSNLRSVTTLTEDIAQLHISILGQSKLVECLEPALHRNVNADVAQMTAFETLEALRTGCLDKTQCPICLGSLGCEEKISSPNTPTSTVMVSCGHLFCSNCLNQHCLGKLQSNQPMTCPNCRKQFCQRDDVIYIDHQLKDEEDFLAHEREKAKEIVKEASILLANCNGQLDASIWRALYLAFDVPLDVPDEANTILPALPKAILAHFRAATGMKAHCDHHEFPAMNSRSGAGLCSKIEALLADLPRNERSVVFSSSKECVKHLIEVFKHKGVECRALFTGQSLQVLKQAVSEWEGPSVPVLLVQAGAAASGLTLTAASKLFIMEPFLRVEEEQQAYARLHRFGQTSAVQVRCYFHPVSVESRLLAWRNSAEEFQSKYPAFFNKTTDTIQNTKKDSMNDGEEQLNSLGDIETPEETAQALFLLGLLV